MLLLSRPCFRSYVNTTLVSLLLVTLILLVEQSVFRISLFSVQTDKERLDFQAVWQN